jgi:uncharacterized membrane protein YjjP (DUF1212 family)
VNVVIGKNYMDYKLLFNYALKTGRIMLENGAETYRVEDTMERILKTSHFEVVETFVTPTGFFMSFDDPSIETITRVQRLKHRTLHLHKVSEANDLSRKFCNGTISLEEAWAAINEVETSHLYHPITIILAVGLAAGFFSLMFGANFIDFIISFVIGTISGCVMQLLGKYKVSPYFISLVGGLIIGILAKYINSYLPLSTHLDLIIIGTLMPLVPGVAITNGIMDTIRGDLVSGLARSADAIVTATFIAIGVGIGLKLITL